MFAILDFLENVVNFVITIFDSLIMLFDLLTTGIPSVLFSVANLPTFIVSGITVTISVCIVMVLLSRRSS